MRNLATRGSERVDPSQLGNAGSSRLINYDRIEIACNVLRDTGRFPRRISHPDLAQRLGTAAVCPSRWVRTAVSEDAR
jgi:hypothetical protein